MANIVNIDSRLMEMRFQDILGSLLSEVSWLKDWRIQADEGRDWLISEPASGSEIVLGLLCKTGSFGPSELLRLAESQRLSGKRPNMTMVLAMPRVSARMAELCRQQGWSWFDLAGNCRIEIPGMLLIDRSGREPVELPPREANLGTPEAGRVVRALLAPENAGKRWTQREMVAHFAERAPPIPAPSLALVNKVVQHLRDQAFLQPLSSRGFQVRDFEGLLQAWQRDYRFDRNRRHSYFTLLHPKQIQERLRAFDPDGEGRLALAAFSAADHQAPAVRQPRLWLYLRAGLEREFEAALEAKQVDSGENLIVLVSADRGVFYSLEKSTNRPNCTNPVQTYVDLAQAGGRGEEAAEAILMQRLRPAWTAV